MTQQFHLTSEHLLSLMCNFIALDAVKVNSSYHCVMFGIAYFSLHILPNSVQMRHPIASTFLTHSNTSSHMTIVAQHLDHSILLQNAVSVLADRMQDAFASLNCSMLSQIRDKEQRSQFTQNETRNHIPIGCRGHLCLCSFGPSAFGELPPCATTSGVHLQKRMESKRKCPKHCRLCRDPSSWTAHWLGTLDSSTCFVFF